MTLWHPVNLDKSQEFTVTRALEPLQYQRLACLVCDPGFTVAWLGLWFWSPARFCHNKRFVVTSAQWQLYYLEDLCNYQGVFICQHLATAILPRSSRPGCHSLVWYYEFGKHWHHIWASLGCMQMLKAWVLFEQAYMVCIGKWSKFPVAVLYLVCRMTRVLDSECSVAVCTQCIQSGVGLWPGLQDSECYKALVQSH